MAAILATYESEDEDDDNKEKSKVNKIGEKDELQVLQETLKTRNLPTTGTLFSLRERVARSTAHPRITRSSQYKTRVKPWTMMVKRIGVCELFCLGNCGPSDIDKKVK